MATDKKRVVAEDILAAEKAGRLAVKETKRVAGEETAALKAEQDAAEAASYAANLTTALVSGKPFRTEHVVGGPSTVIYLTPQEIAHNQQARDDHGQQQQDKVTAKASKIQRLRAADTSGKLAQWIEDELL